MTAATMQAHGHSHAGAILLVCLVIAAIVAGLVYGELAQSIHARKAHQGQAWTAESIQAYFDAGKCKPNVYACPAGDFEVHYCEVHPGKAIGLVIGATVRQVITGFMASTGYWQSRCQ